MTQHCPSEEWGEKQIPLFHFNAHTVADPSCPLVVCNGPLHFLGRNLALLKELRLHRLLIRAETTWQAPSGYAAPPEDLAHQEDPRRRTPVVWSPGWLA